MGFRSASDVAFLQLSDSVFCVQCELISYNNTSNCLACGSQAILNLGRLMGGSLLAEETATVITDEKMRRVVAELLGPGAIGRNPATPVEAPEVPEIPGPRLVARSAEHSTAVAARIEQTPDLEYRVVNGSLMHLDSPVRMVLDRAMGLTRASGSALALISDGKMQCHATMGAGVPGLGAQVSVERGLSGMSVRTGKAWRCDQVTGDPVVDLQACRSLGIQSLVVAPLVHLKNVLGILEVLSTEPYAFDDHDVATVQFLASLMVMTLTRQTGKGPASVLAAAETLPSRRTSSALVV
jgi:GAF domain-containing protein